MNREEFRTTLSLAVSGNIDALADLTELYMPLINKYSYVNGKLDEDLRQNILLELVRSISRFEIKLLSEWNISSYE